MPSKSPQRLIKPTPVADFGSVPHSVGKEFQSKKKALAKALRTPASMNAKDQVSKDGEGC